MKLGSLDYLLSGCVGEYHPMQVCVTGWDAENPFEWRVKQDVENSEQEIENSEQHLLFVSRWVSGWKMPEGDWTQEKVRYVYKELDDVRRQVQWLLSGGGGDDVWRKVYVDTFCSVVAYMDALHNRCSAEEWYSEVEKLSLLWLLDFSVLDYRLLCLLKECNGRCKLAWEMLKKWRSFVWGDRDERIPAQLYVWQSDIFGFEYLVEIDDIVSSKTESNRRLYSNRCVSRDSLTDAESPNFKRFKFLWYCLFYLLRDGVRCGDKSIYYRQLVFHIIMCEEAILDYMGVLDVIAQYGATEEKENKLESILFLDSHQKGVVLGAFELKRNSVYDAFPYTDEEGAYINELSGFSLFFDLVMSDFPALWQKIVVQVEADEADEVSDKHDDKKREMEEKAKAKLAFLNEEYGGKRFMSEGDYNRLVGYVEELVIEGKCPENMKEITMLNGRSYQFVTGAIYDINMIVNEGKICEEWVKFCQKLFPNRKFKRGDFSQKPQNFGKCAQ